MEMTRIRVDLIKSMTYDQMVEKAVRLVSLDSCL